MNEHDSWFAEHVLPLEGALSAYLRRVWSDPHEIDDLRQEVYVRVYEASLSRRPPAINFFVFSVARNLLADRLRRQRVVTIDLIADLESLNVWSNEVPVDQVLSGRQELARLQQALESLPTKCREVFMLRKIEGLSQRDAARRLGVTESTVEKQTSKAMRVLSNGFLQPGDALPSSPTGQIAYEIDEARL